MKNNAEPKDMSFVLKRKAAPLSFMLNSRHTSSNPLMHWDGKQNRTLRYARNQKSPFEDEQDDHAIIEPIIFEDGALFVSKQNPILQQFLLLHPMFNKSFEILDYSLDAQEELDEMEASDEAISAYKTLSVDQLLSVARVQLNLNTDKLSMPEIKRDVRRYAESNPSKFLSAIDDPDLNVSDIITVAFTKGFLKTRSNDTQVWFNLPSNKTKMIDIVQGTDLKVAVSEHFKTDDGISVMEMLESHCNED